MEIKSIETKHVTSSPFAGLIAPENGTEFTPYYQTTIRYTDPRDGERANRVYNVTGKGETEYASEQDAIESLKAEISTKAIRAYEKFMVANGAGNLEIA